MKPSDPIFVERRSSHGFTLIELLAVITIIGVLAAIIISVTGKVRESARKTTSIARLHAAGTALQTYAADNRGIFLPVRNYFPYRWHILIIPYLNTGLAEAYQNGKIDSNKLINSGYFKCPTMETDELNGTNLGAYGYNPWLEVSIDGTTPPIRINNITTPGTLPVLVTTGTTGGPRLFASNPYAPAPTTIARQYGYSGPTNDYGPNPNFGRNALFLFGDWHVSAVDVCNANAWPWNDINAFRVR